MGHYQKLVGRPLYYVPADKNQIHIFNGGYRRKRSRVYKEVSVPLLVIYRPVKAQPYGVVDGVLRRNPKTLPTWQRKQGTLRADVRRARRQAKGFCDESRSKAYRSVQTAGRTRMGVDGR